MADVHIDVIETGSDGKIDPLLSAWEKDELLWSQSTSAEHALGEVQKVLRDQRDGAAQLLEVAPEAVALFAAKLRIPSELLTQRITSFWDVVIEFPLQEIELGFITFRGEKDRFKGYGVEIRSVAGDMATARIPREAVDKLRKDPDVQHVELPGRPRANGKITSGAIHGVDFVAASAADQARTRLNQVATGAGTVIGVIDLDGLDVYHPAFLASNGGSRVERIWDQRLVPRNQGKTPAPWNYGTEYTPEDLKDELGGKAGFRHQVVGHRPQRNSHGTACAGVAAGSPDPSNGWRGMAPGASIIYVSVAPSGRKSFVTLVEVADALHYIFEKAGERPCSVSISLGDGLGPHDGTSPLERFIDNLLCVPGRSVALAVGNHNGGNLWTRGEVPAGGRVQSSFRLPLPAVRGESIEVWYEGPPVLRVTILPPERGGEALSVEPDSKLRVFDIEEKVAARGPVRMGTRLIAFTRQHHINRRRSYLRLEMSVLHGCERMHAEGWSIVLENTGKDVVQYRGYIDSGAASGATWTSADIAGPTALGLACCRLAFGVGSYSMEEGGIARSTECTGPTVDGRNKPDLVAVGYTVLVPKAVGPDAYSDSNGSSIAAPQVAGATALLFEALGARTTHADLRFVLRAMADRTGVPAEHPAYGWGRLRLGPQCGGIHPLQAYLPKTIHHHEDKGLVPYVGPSPWTSPGVRVVASGDSVRVTAPLKRRLQISHGRVTVHAALLPLTAYVAPDSLESMAALEIDLAAPESPCELTLPAPSENEGTVVIWLDSPLWPGAAIEHAARHHPGFAVQSIVHRNAEPSPEMTVLLHAPPRQSHIPARSTTAYLHYGGLAEGARLVASLDGARPREIPVPAGSGAVALGAIDFSRDRSRRLHVRVVSLPAATKAWLDVGQVFDGVIVGGARMVIGDDLLLAHAMHHPPRAIFDTRALPLPDEAGSADAADHLIATGMTKETNMSEQMRIKSDLTTSASEQPASTGEPSTDNRDLAASMSEQMQMEKGIYKVQQAIEEAFVVVAWLVVTVDGNNSVERWYLSTAAARKYTAPSKDAQDVKTQFLYVTVEGFTAAEPFPEKSFGDSRGLGTYDFIRCACVKTNPEDPRT